MDEVWRNMAGYEGLYMISNKGRVKSIRGKRVDKNGVVYRLQEKILSQPLNAYGYPVVGLVDKNGVHRARPVHRLLALTFLPNPENKRCIDHINGVRNDNRLENLRWATHKENSDNKYRLGNQVEWEDRNISKESRYRFTHSQSRAVVRSDGKRFDSIAAAARALGLRGAGSVSSCVRGITKSVRGYTFRYEDEELNKKAAERIERGEVRA